MLWENVVRKTHAGIYVHEYLFYMYPHYLIIYPELFTITLSGRIGKVVASHAEGCQVTRSNPGCGWAAPIYTMHEALRGYCPWGWGCDQSIWSTVSHAIVRNWLWSTATRSFPLGYFSNYCKQLIIDPKFGGSRFSTHWEAPGHRRL